MFDPIKYQRTRYHKRKDRYIAQLGGECIECGSTEDLEFDHINPETKAFTITTRISKYSEEVLQEELKKCQLLCSPCHQEKSAEELKDRVPWNKGMSEGPSHGTYAMAYPVSVCDCKECEAYREKRRASRRSTDKARPQTRTLTHGTRAGYLKELRRGLDPCDSCKKANAIYHRELMG